MIFFSNFLVKCENADWVIRKLGENHVLHANITVKLDQWQEGESRGEL